MILLIRNSCQDSLADMLYEIMRTVNYVLFVCLQSLFGVGVLIKSSPVCHEDSSS